MTLEHKLRQQMFNQLETFDDIIPPSDYIIRNNTKCIISDTIDYFTKPYTQIIYPSKSYAVAIIYAHYIEQYFDVPFYTSLNDPMLLWNNDKFFVPYMKSFQIYDAILSNIQIPFLNLPLVNSTTNHFHKEFYLTDNPYFS